MAGMGSPHARNLAIGGNDGIGKGGVVDVQRQARQAAGGGALQHRLQRAEQGGIGRGVEERARLRCRAPIPQPRASAHGPGRRSGSASAQSRRRWRRIRRRGAHQGDIGVVAVELAVRA